MTNKLDGIFNLRYPVYHLKDGVVKFEKNLEAIIKQRKEVLSPVMSPIASPTPPPAVKPESIPVLARSKSEPFKEPKETTKSSILPVFEAELSQEQRHISNLKLHAKSRKDVKPDSLQIKEHAMATAIEKKCTNINRSQSMREDSRPGFGIETHKYFDTKYSSSSELRSRPIPRLDRNSWKSASFCDLSITPTLPFAIPKFHSQD